MFSKGVRYATVGDATALDDEPPETDRWYHLVGVMEDYRNRPTLYVDGEQIASETYDGARASDDNTVVGRGKFGGNHVDFVAGTIGEVRIFEKALRADEVADLYESTR